MLHTLSCALDGVSASTVSVSTFSASLFVVLWVVPLKTYTSDELALGEEGKVVFTVVPGTYTVTETHPGTNWSAPVYSKTEVTVAAGGSDSVTITNCYTAPQPQLGSITVEKVLDSDSDPHDISTFEITLTGPNDYSETQTVAAGSSVTFSGLAEGTYTVSETSPGEGWTVSYSEQEVEVGADDEYEFTVTVTNKYTAPVPEPETGSLKVSKIHDDGGDDYGTQAPTFKIGIEPTDMALTQLDGETWPKYVELGLGDSYTFTNLAPGYYRVFEEDIPDNWVWTNEDLDPVYVEAGETAEAYIYNIYIAPEPEPETGSLVVTKELDNSGDPYSGTQTFKIGIRRVEDVALTEVDEPQYVYLGIGQSHTFTGLMPGLYEVFEEDVPANWQWTNPEQLFVWVSAGEESTADPVLNKYTAPTPPPPPPPPASSLLTVYYREWGTNQDLRTPTTHSGYVGATQVATAPDIEGYELREGEPASYTHTFGASNTTYTFWYELVIEEEEPPLAPTGGISATMMYGIGVSLLGLGLATKKRGKRGRR